MTETSKEFWDKVDRRKAFYEKLPKSKRKAIELAYKRGGSLVLDPTIGLSIPIAPYIPKTNESSYEKNKRKTLLARQDGRCAYCEVPFSNDNQPTFDHIKPKSKGGSNHLDNLVLACRKCNGLKGDLHTHREAMERATLYMAFADMLKEKGYLE